MLIYGKNCIRYYIRNYPQDINELFLLETKNAEKYDFEFPSGVNITKADRNFFEQKFKSANHQGIAAYVEDYKYTELESLEITNSTLILILDGVQDPANLGAVLRSAEAFSADAVIIPKDRASGVTPAVVRASSGAARGVPVCRVTNIARTIEYLQQNNVWVLAVDMDENVQELKSYEMKGAHAFILGAEGRGVRRLSRDKSDLILRIPMSGEVDSLNVSVSAALVLYEYRRQNADINKT